MTESGCITISTTSTAASMRRWYRKVVRSFFIWMLLSSIWATVKMRILHFLQNLQNIIHRCQHELQCLNYNVLLTERRVKACTLCWRRRKGSSISMPPSWTIHHTSMWPSVKTLSAWREGRDVLGHQQGFTGSGGFSTSSVMKACLSLLFTLMNTVY